MLPLVRIVISIHAPREGGDFFDFHAAKSQDISIHAPREGGDPAGLPVLLPVWVFQSTPPARGATKSY